VNDYTRRQVRNRKRRIEYRLRDRSWEAQDEPMLSAGNIQYEMADRSRGLAAGGIGMVHLLARRTGLVEAIDDAVQVLKIHLPYHESDHVLNIAYNALNGGTCLEDIELRRNDEVYLDAVGAQRIPDPTTAGDFCRRFTEEDIECLMEAINGVRVKVWGQQPEEFFEEAVLDADGTLAETTGQCKQGMDISYDGVWGYHPLLISLANTKEPLYLVNRSGNRPSQEGAAGRFDQAVALCREAGFRKILLRGDTDFSQTRYLDGWDDQGVGFIFGIDAMPNLVARANGLPGRRWRRLRRAERYAVATEPRQRPDNVKEQIVRERGFAVNVPEYAIAGATALLGLLMVSSIPYRSFKELDLRHSFLTLVFVVFAVSLVILEPSVTLFSIGILYTIHGPIEWLIRQRSGRRLEEVAPTMNETPQG